MLFARSVVPRLELTTIRSDPMNTTRRVFILGTAATVSSLALPISALARFQLKPKLVEVGLFYCPYMPYQELEEIDHSNASESE